MDYVEYADFAKLEIKVVRVLEAGAVEGSKKLVRLKVDVGDTERTVVAGIADQYDPDELIGMKIVMLLNLKPKIIFGVESQGMILAADSGSVVSVLRADKDMPEGSVVR